ncbi:unnamed protein product [Agarophyton chilense]
MEGFLAKRGKRIGSRVKRYMRLQGAFLTNHHAPHEPPTWRVDISDASISCNTAKNRIVLHLYGNRLDLFADSSADCDLWFHALSAVVRDKAAAVAAAKENRQPNANANRPPLVTLDSDGIMAQNNAAARRAASRTSDLGVNFKVVKPNSSLSAATVRSTASSDEPHESTQPLAVNGHVYEETPASMIFKQFNFPPQ